MKPDELWEKYAVDELIDRDYFLTALKEYGDYRAEETRKQAVSVCRDEKEGHVMSKYAKLQDCQIARNVADNCAAAIEKMELP